MGYDDKSALLNGFLNGPIDEGEMHTSLPRNAIRCLLDENDSRLFRYMASLLLKALSYSPISDIGSNWPCDQSNGSIIEA